MRKMRKGFTLVELLIVIGIIGILSSMAMMGGTEANNIATANKILEEFRIIGAAMNMYYADNRNEVEDPTTTNLAGKIKAGLAPYMKNTNALADSSTVGKYTISVNATTGQWWLSYKLPQAESKVALILANKAKTELLRNTDTDTDSTTTTTPAETEGGEPTVTTTSHIYDGTTDTVYMRVR